MKPSIEPIPELAATVLVRHHHDAPTAVFEADCRRIERGQMHLFRLRCEGVARVERWLGTEGDSETEYTEITQAYREPLGEGRLLVTLDLGTESEWIEIECRSMEVAELHR